jgi:broad specificity phosphatase PhoE
LGKEQAQSVAFHLKHTPFAQAWSSNLSRAIEVCYFPATISEELKLIIPLQTAETIIKTQETGLVLKQDIRLTERSLGSIEGQADVGQAEPSDAESWEA